MPDMKKSMTLFISFAKIGLFTFGGGYAMIPLIQQEVIDNKKWLERQEFLELLTLAQSSPGPMSLNTAVFVGYKMNGIKGALSALLGAVLPSFVIILLIAMFFSSIRHNPTVEAVFKGMRPAVVALIISPMLSLAKGFSWKQYVFAAMGAFAICYFHFSPMWLLVIGAVVGIAYGLYKVKFPKK